MIRGGSFAIAGAALLLAVPALAVDPPVETYEIDDAAVFKAAGFKLATDAWHGCGDPGTAGYLPGQIEQVADLNGDGFPEAIITESSSFCFGATEVGYTLLSSDPSGEWRVLGSGPGFVTVLATRGTNDWPDLQVGGPGFCHQVLRWDGAAYTLNRKEYEGKAC